jgi:hypothetical protein
VPGLFSANAQGGPGPAGPARARVVATAGEVVLRRSLTVPPKTPISVYEPLPHPMPMIARLAEEIHYLRVAVDQSGAIESAATARCDTRTRADRGGNPQAVRTACG